MKKPVSIMLRLLLAVAGIGFILWTLTFTDHLTVPAGYELANGQVVQHSITLDVVHFGDAFISAEIPADSELAHLLTPPGGNAPVTFNPARSEIGDQPGELEFKPGIITTLKRADGRLLIAGFFMVALILPLQAWRWWLLLQCRGLIVPYKRAFDLSLVGLFFNFCMPGSTGGDVVKAYYAAKGSGARTVAVMSVVFDRVAGLFGLVLIAAFAGLVLFFDPNVPPVTRTVTAIIWAILIAGCIFGACYFSSRTREMLGLNRLMRRWSDEHFLNKVDSAASAYRQHPKVLTATISISVVVHLLLTAATVMAGWALGIQHDFGVLLVVIPVLFLAGSIPLTYQGLGVMEGLGLAMLAIPSLASANQIIAMLVLIRLYQLAYGLLGSLILLRGDIHMFPQTDEINDQQ